MSSATVDTSRSDTASTDASRRWIISSRADTFLVLLTPLLAIPTVMMLSSPAIGVEAATISIIVASFFALGHHLPGLLRAYGDSELFQRFRLRFLLAPPLVLLAYFPLYHYHFDLYRLIILVWATWHGLMQLYGFVRIYDAKVGCTSRATARWDWWVCLCGFVTPRLLRPDQVSSTLNHWYSLGGPAVSPSVVTGIRWGAAALCVVVLLGFTVNYIVCWRRGPKPNPLKLVMLASGIGTWWFAMYYIDELILGVALFDICHDVQYLAIVWLYSCKRVSSNARTSRFMRYMFRRGMVMLYLGLITAYGAIGLVGELVEDGTISRFFFGLIFTSTILHYYYDGFIWKVSERSTGASLGLETGSVASRAREMATGRYAHTLKWAPAIVLLGLLFASDLTTPPLTTARKDELARTYTQSLVGTPVLPDREEEVSWLYSRFEAAQRIAAAVPDDYAARVHAAVMLANFGRNDEAVDRLRELLHEKHDYRDAHIALADIHFYRSNLDDAANHYQAALELASTGEERSAMNLKLGEIHLRRSDLTAARQKFQEAVQDDPRLATSVQSLEKQSSSRTRTGAYSSD